jgi:hypothetical protein
MITDAQYEALKFVIEDAGEAYSTYKTPGTNPDEDEQKYEQTVRGYGETLMGLGKQEFGLEF